MKTEINARTVVESPDYEKERLFYPKFEAVVRLPLLIIAMVLSYFFLSGCAAQERIIYKTIYKDVYVPVKCDITAPERPTQEDSPVLATVDIIRYSTELEIALNACKGE